MELRHVQQFLAVVDCGSFSKAAVSLGIRQGTLSASIQDFERKLGALLFERSPQGASVNSFGKALEPRAREIMNAANRAERTIGELLNVQRGRIVIGAAPAIASGILPITVARFYDSHPDIEVVIVEGYVRSLLPSVRTGEFDCGFGMFGGHNPPVVDLAMETLLPANRVVVAAAADHPLVRKRKITLREVSRAPWALPTVRDFFRSRIIEVFTAANVPPPVAALEYASVALELSVLRAGRHVGAITDLTAHDDFASGALCALPLPELTWLTDLGVFYRKDVPLTPAASRFVAIARDVCNEVRSKGKKR